MKILALATTGATAVGGAMATPIIANDTFEGLPALGSNLGGFMLNLAPGLVALIFVLAVVGGLVAIFYSVAGVIGKSVGGGHRRYR